VKFDRFISGLRRDRPALGVSGKIRPSLGILQRDPTAPMVFYGETDRPLVFPARSDRPGDLRQVSTISLINYFCFDKLTVDPPISLREGVRR
jgi:hypothetical protein